MSAVGFDQIRALEDAMDQADASPGDLGSVPSLSPLVKAGEAEDWELVYVLARGLLDSGVASADEKAFALQWAVIGTEVEFDLRKRRAWLDRWNTLSGADTPYCRYLQAYHHALTSFFESALREADARFRRAFELASALGYERGKQRTLFHLGLIQRDLAQPGAALEYLTRALLIAKSRRDLSYTKRIQAQIERVSGRGKRDSEEFSFARAKAAIENLIKSGQPEPARKVLIEAVLRRRKFKQGRKRENFAVYVPLLLCSRGRIGPDRAWQRLSAIRDPIIRIRCLELLVGIAPPRPGWIALLSGLKELHGISDVVRQSALDQEIEICGIGLESLPDPDIRNFMKLLVASSDPVDKETICKALWNLKYDPIAHDGRVYKLVHKTRKHFKRADLLLNTYGAYQIDPRYRIKKPQTQAS